MWFSKLRRFKFSPRMAEWVLTIYSILIGFLLGFLSFHGRCE